MIYITYNFILRGQDSWEILEKFNQGDTSIARTPIDTSQHLSKNRGDRCCTSRILKNHWKSDVSYELYKT